MKAEIKIKFGGSLFGRAEVNISFEGTLEEFDNVVKKVFENVKIEMK